VSDTSDTSDTCEAIRRAFALLLRDQSHGDRAMSAACKLLSTATEGVMSLVRLLGFTTLACGCVVGRYREVATSREVAYVEEKGKTCGSHAHRRNHTVALERFAAVSPIALNTKAS
jgi:hypothetical protein